MIRYALAACALKAFSVNSASKSLYRQIGNHVGARLRRTADIRIYHERGKLFLDLCKRHQIVRDGDNLLEVGTGWMHWYSIYLRLFYRIHVTTLDIWDNRQLSALKAAFQKLAVSLEHSGGGQTISDTLRTVVHARDFDELYRNLDLEYVIEPTGSLDQFPDECFDSVFSFHVLEHVRREDVVTLIRAIHRVLAPGGWTIHQIGIDDHLAHYDRSASAKQYLRYSDRAWRTFFENDVQYFNRLQLSDWLDVFEQSGFLLVEGDQERADIDMLRIHPTFQKYSREDLACTILTIVHKKLASN
jgi:predicted SAM-dependent methyltransferase